MKKLWISSVAVSLFATTAGAQETDLPLKSYAIEMNQHNLTGTMEKAAKTNDLTNSEFKYFNYQTRESFYSDFGYIPITAWEVYDEFNKISFVKKGILYTAYYDLDDELVGTISDVSVTDLPDHAVDNINKKYKGYEIEGAVFFDDNEQNETDMIYYGKWFEDEDKYFVELKNDEEKIVVQVNTAGNVSFFTSLK